MSLGFPEDPAARSSFVPSALCLQRRLPELDGREKFDRDPVALGDKVMLRWSFGTLWVPKGSLRASRLPSDQKASGRDQYLGGP